MMQTKGFSHDMVAHLWANKSQDQAEGCNMFFYGPKIYSYGYHFCIANFVDFNTILFTTDSYSISTAKHINYVSRSLPSYTTIYNVPNVEASTKKDHKKNYKDYQDRIEREARRLSKARVYTDTGVLMVLIADMNSYSKLFKLGYQEFSADNYQAIIAGAAIRAKKDERRHKAEIRRKEKAQRVLADRILPLWSSGEDIPYPDRNAVHTFRPIYGTEFLRVRPNDPETVETTNGAQVPAEHCRKVWPLIKRICERKEEFKPNGHTIKIGHFQISHISKDGIITAGCHTFKFSEFERFAKVLGL